MDTTPSAPEGTQPKTTLIPVNVPAGWEGGFAEGTLPQGGTSARLDLLIGFLLLAASAVLFGRRLFPVNLESRS